MMSETTKYHYVMTGQCVLKYSTNGWWTGTDAGYADVPLGMTRSHVYDLIRERLIAFALEQGAYGPDSTMFILFWSLEPDEM